MSPPTHAAVSTSLTAVPNPTVPPTKACFNASCKRRTTDPRNKGWPISSGEHVDLCDHCFKMYIEGVFCEVFHKDSSGWRSCDSCLKPVHCGCIVSASRFMHLDGGGIVCCTCYTYGFLGRKLMSSSLLPSQISERTRELPAKGHNQVSGSFPGQWRQAANLWNVGSAQSELHQRLAYEFDRPSISEKLLSGRSSFSANEKKIDYLPDKTASGNLIHVTRERYANGIAGMDSVSAFNAYCGEEGKTDSLQIYGHFIGENDATFTRNGLNVDHPCSTGAFNCEAHPNSLVNSLPSSSLKEDSTSPTVGFAASFSPPSCPNDPTRTVTIQPNRQTAPPSPPVRQISSSHDLIDPNGELQAHLHNERHQADATRADGRVRGQILHRHWPLLTDQELQQVSGDSNSHITPLFEKVLSASDTGRIGRLVLPKKYAEACFPPISHSEGLPLKVQDATGNEWSLQFRFWPNNNSRMYVLEGVSPCIQSMQLQAGDTVTFSRIGPERKLLMGYRKASNMSPEQENQTLKAGNSLGTPLEATEKSTSPELVPNIPLRPPKSSTELRNPIVGTDQGVLCKPDRSSVIQENGPAAKSLQASTKKKGSTIGSMSKRLRIDYGDSIDLQLTWGAAQNLLRPPNGVPSVVIIEGHEFEEYEEAPVIGMPTFFATNQYGEKRQWVQCEDCSKWRKLPVDVLLPSRWTCSANIWDQERFSCSAPQELSLEQLACFLPIKTGSSKRSKVKMEADVVEVSDGLDTLANLAILGEGGEPPPSSQTTTKHPRHRTGCTCIVCIQPPSGKGPKHSLTCTCNVCLTVKRRFATLMLNRERRQSEKEAEGDLKQQHINQSTEILPQIWSDALPTNENFSSSPQRSMVNIDRVVDDESDRIKSLPSPLKAHIDLNIQPEREEEPSLGANTGSIEKTFSNADILATF